VFLDADLNPWADQWAFLASVHRLSREQIESVVQRAERRGRVLGVRLPPQEDDEREPWSTPPSRRPVSPPISGTLPVSIEVLLGNQIYISKDGLPPPSLRNRLLRLAAFQNPEFYQPQALRLSTYGTPRVIACAEDFPHHIGLPRGLLDDCSSRLAIWASPRQFATSAAPADLLQRPSRGGCGPSSKGRRRPSWRMILACWRPQARSARR
jgi:hypothetical protein